MTDRPHLGRGYPAHLPRDRPVFQVIHSRPHDLPPRWDGRRVTWGPWTLTQSTMMHHAKAEDLVCGHCGAIDWEPTAFGTIHLNPDETRIERKVLTTKSGGHYLADRPTTDPWVWALLVSRCTHCATDRVLDRRDGTTWVLDPDDYTDQGSYPDDTPPTKELDTDATLF